MKRRKRTLLLKYAYGVFKCKPDTGDQYEDAWGGFRQCISL